MIRKWFSALLASLTATAGLGVSALRASAVVSPPWDPYFAAPTTVADLSTIVPSSSSNRDFGFAAGDFDGDAKADLVVGRTDGRVFYLKGNGNGTFVAPVLFSTWKLETFNAWAFAAGDVNGDGKLDVVWGANASGADTGGTTRVNDGDLRYLVGNGDGTFATANNYVRSGITFNAGTLIADVGTDTGSLAVGDIDGDTDLDIVTGSLNSTSSTSTVQLLRNTGGGAFAAPIALISQAVSCTTPCTGIYYPAISTQNSPWGLSIADADADGDRDLWVTDRALYTYLYRNDGTGSFTLQGSNTTVTDRPNAYLGHDTYRAAVGFTASTAAGDVNGDGKADVALGIQSGTQTPSSNTLHDGEVLLDVSQGAGHTSFGSLADIGTEARGVTLVDVNGDGYRDIVSGNYEGQVKLLRQLPPLDTDGDGVSDYVDNAPAIANAARLDMNTDASVTYRDQLDNDFDTVLGDPENQATWQRRGDPADTDDDNDGVLDGSDNCAFTANASQSDIDGDGRGDACDPLDNRDSDEDGWLNGPNPGDPLFNDALAAKAKWSEGSTHFVIRIDALGRFFQNEFTQLLTDAATLSPSDWATKCWQDYNDADDPPDPCGTGEGTPSQTLTLAGGKQVPVTLVTIPKQLWTDPPVITWINDRNDNARLEIGQHGTYHTNNIPVSDWKDLTDRNFFSCEPCGLSLAENYELMKVGYDTLLGNYTNKWVAESGATGSSPKIDWSSSAHPLLSFAPPFDTSDPTARDAISQLGFKAFSASVYEEGEAGTYGPIFSPEGSHHEQFDQFGMFHASADVELDPPATSSGTYDVAAFEDHLNAETDQGGLTTWLIEEVEWSGRPCNDLDRLGTCSGGSNRENNTVYDARWNAWMQLLDFVNNYPDSVAMTMGEVALARAYDNAPTVANADQADADHDGIGDVIDDATLSATHATLTRNESGNLSATLTDGSGAAMAGQSVGFSFDSDGNGTPETQTATTNATGVATVSVTPTRPVGPASFSATWNGGHGVLASDTGAVTVVDITSLTLDASNPSTGQVGDMKTVGATLKDGDGAGVAGRTVQFSIGSASGEGTTDAAGHATATFTLQGPPGDYTLDADFVGDDSYGGSNDSAPFTVSAAPPPTHTLTVTKAGAGSGTVTSEPPGINCGPNCSADFDEGTEITLTATADNGSVFSGWSGAGCSGTGTCVVTLDADQTVTATFEPSANLSVALVAAPDPVRTGDDLTYSLTVGNAGPSPATGVILTDSLPSGVVLESATASQGTCSESAGTVTCSLGGLSEGSTATATIVVAPTTGPGTYHNSADVGAVETDPSPVDNTASSDTTVTGAACTTIGTPGDDSSLAGTAGNDVICGLAGNDTISGATGNDFIQGGSGDDTLSGDEGNDNLIPGLGTDSVDGGAGSDTVNYIDLSSPVSVDLTAQTANDGSATDSLSSIENATGSPKDDILTGDGGPNTLLGAAGDDTLSGGDGNDYLGGSAGADTSTGGNGNDILAPGLGDDPLNDGGADTDTVTYISEPLALGVNVDLGAGTVTGGAGSDALANIENATGSQLGDTLTGNSGPNILLAANGNDALTGGDGNDFMTGGPGVDSLTGGNGDDGLAPGPGDETTIDGGAGVDNVTYFDATTPVTIDLAAGTETGGGGTDTITGFEKATGSPLGDTITGDAGANTLLGGNGDDILNGAAGDDFLLASLGDDTLHGDDGNDRLAPGLGNDATVDGGNGTDLVTYLLDVVATGVNVDLGAGTVAGGAGTDSLTSVEQVTGSTADDSLTGSAAANQLFGVGGNDSLSGLDGNDYLAGGAGNDAHDGGLGYDGCIDTLGENTFTACESPPSIAERIVTPSGQTAEAAEISYELSVGRWVRQQEALQRLAKGVR